MNTENMSNHSQYEYYEENGRKKNKREVSIKNIHILEIL